MGTEQEKTNLQKIDQIIIHNFIHIHLKNY